MSKILRSLSVFGLLLFTLLAGNTAFAKGAVKAKVKAPAPTFYSMGITDAQGCSGTLTVSPTFICSGQSATLTASGSGGYPYRFDWACSSAPCTAPGGSTVTGGTNSVSASVTPTVTTTYTVTITAGFGTSAQCGSPVVKSVVVTVGANPTANAGVDGNFCVGDVVNLGGAPTGSGGTGALTYSWSPTPGSTMSSNTGANPTATPTSTTDFTVIVTDTKGCTASDNAIWTKKTVTATPSSNQSICVGGCATVSVTAGANVGPNAFTYAWSSSGGAVAATTSGVSVCPTVQTTYTVTVSDGGACSATAFTVVSVGSLIPTITGTTSICAGTSTSLTATPGTGWTWSPVAKISGSNTLQTITTTTLAAGTYPYNVTVTDASGCSGTATTTVTVNPNPVVTTIDPGGIFCAPSACYTINNVYGGGTLPFTYSWTSAPGYTPTPTGATPCVSPTVTTAFNVVVTDSKSCSASATTTITIRTLSLSMSASPATVCPGTEPSTLNAGLTTNPAPNNPPITYTWSGCALSSTSAAMPTATPTASCVYFVTVTDGSGCQTTGQVPVSIKTISATATASPTSVCPGGTTTLTGTEGSGSGTAPLAYSWTPNPVASTVTPNNASPATSNPTATTTYGLVITDAKGCSATANTVVTVLPIPTPSITPTFVCSGVSATLDAGACAGCLYNWQPGSLTGNPLTVTPTTTTTYTVTVTNAGGCSGTASGVVTVNPNPVAMAEPGVAPFKICLGQSFTMGGNATTVPNATGTLGTPGYVFSWSAPAAGAGTYSPGSTASNPTVTPTATGPGYVYTVLVTDSKGCTASDDVTLIVNGPPVADAGPDKTICYNSSTTIGLPATGGSGGYNYAWSPTNTNSISNTGSATASLVGNLNATYVVLVTDAAGCTSTDNVSISVLTQLDATGTFTPATCGNSDGSATVNPTGGSFVYNYSWSPFPAMGQTGPTATSLSGNSYSVTVTDGNFGCSTSIVINVPNANGPQATITSHTDVTCFTANNTGSATVDITAGTGTPNYTYQWDSGTPITTVTASLTNTVTGLAAGAHGVTVTDANGCKANASITITRPPQLTVTTASTPPSCGSTCDATSTATGGGGSNPGGILYKWSDPSAQTTATASNLCAGSYNVTITDPNDAACQATSSVTINPPVAINAVVGPVTNVSCNGACNGTATVTASGASGNFGFTWSDGQSYTGTSCTATGLCAGSTYTVTVSDFNNATCTFITTTSVTEPAVLAITQGAIVGAPCGGTGSTCVTASGGTPSYTYTWSPAPVPGPTTGTAGGGASICMSGGAGAYTCNITDTKGCTASINSIISSVGGPTVTLTVTNATIAGNDGSLDACGANTTGGTLPYTYTWSPLPAAGQTGCIATGLTPGNYCVTVTDGSGCIAVNCATVSAPPPLSIAFVKHNPTCFGATGCVDATANGGTSPYTYDWPTPIASCVSIPGTCTGCGLLANVNYVVTVTDAMGATTTNSVMLTEPTQVTITLTPTHINCPPTGTGTDCASGNGGTPFLTANKYNFSWSNGGTTPCISGLAAGPYSVTVTDKNGCTATASNSITQVPPLAISASVNKHVSCPFYTDGRINLSVLSGGTGPYNGVFAPSGLSVIILTAGGPSVVVGNASFFGAGGHTVTVTDANGCQRTALVNITQPNPIQFGPSTFTPPSCNGGGGTGTVCITSGGTPNFTYTWPSPATPLTTTGASPSCSTVSGLTVANNPYIVKVTDSNGCTQAAPSITITQPTKVSVSITGSKNPSCFGKSDGTATASASGGNNTSYIYTWSPAPGTLVGQGTASVSGLPAGTYSVSVTDANGCTSTSATVTLTDPLAMGLSVTPPVTHVTCFGGSDGSITVTPTGGNGGNTFVWAPAPASLSVSATASNLNSVAGGKLYSVTVTDMNGCSASTSQSITQPTQVVPTATVAQHVLCKGVNIGTINVNSVGGSNSYANYNWSPAPATGQNTASPTGLSGNIYFVTVTDTKGCTGTATATVTEPATAVNVTVTVNSNVSCNGGTNGQLTANPSGGTPGYTYAWSPAPAFPQATASVTNLSANTYVVIVTDKNGCKANASGTITEPPAMTLVITPPQTVCLMQTANLSVIPIGGTFSNASGGGGTYVWSNGPPNNPALNPTGPPPGNVGTTGQFTVPNTLINYSVSVTDMKGCMQVATTTVSVRPAISPSTTIDIPAVCASDNETVTLTASAVRDNPPPVFTYTWSASPGGPLGTGSTVTTVPMTNTTYTVTVSDGCSPDVVATTQVVAYKAPYTVITGVIDGCDYPNPVTLDVNLGDPSTVGINNPSYKWTVNGNTAPSQPAAPYSASYSYIGGTLSPDKSYSSYSVLLNITSNYTNPNKSCNSKLPMTSSFKVFQLPDVSIKPVQDIVTDLKPDADYYCLPNNFAKTPFKSYAWDFGDGKTFNSNSSNFASHTFPNQAGSYNVVVNVVSGDGCPGVAAFTQVVEPLTEFWIPDAFTPNGDGLNDIFVAKGVNVKEYEMYIYDRWGNMIYYSTDIDKGWDGKAHNGSEVAQQDVYIYKITITDYHGKKLKPFTGKVNLIR